MKKAGFFSICLLIYFLVHAQGAQDSVRVPVNSSGSYTQPALLHLPSDYYGTQQKYPLLVFLHGAANSSNPYNLSKIYNDSSLGGPAYFIASNQWPASFVNPGDGQSYKFIVISPQTNSWSTTPSSLNWIINHMVLRYRVDPNRIYLTGVSAGGGGITCYTGHMSGNGQTYTTVNPKYKAAAIVPMSSATGTPRQIMATNTIADNVHVWGFGSENDIHGVNTHLYVSGNYNNHACGCTGLGVLGRFTAFVGGHCCWNTYYDPNYREIVNGRFMNIYEWMLQYARGSGNTGGQNISPTANAGNDQTIILPTNSVSMNGAGADQDGSITGYQWSYVSGPTQYSFNNSSISNPTISDLILGTYTFRLTVTDNQGATSSDEVRINVQDQQTPAGLGEIQVNIFGGSNPYSNSQWNNWVVSGLTNISSGEFNYSDGTHSTIYATLSHNQSVADNGSTYGGNLIPAQVLRHTSYSTTLRTLTLYGLQTSLTYNLEFYASRNSTTADKTILAINGNNIPISTSKNFSNKAFFSNISPDLEGRIKITISKSGTYNYLNGFRITEVTSSSTSRIILEEEKMAAKQSIDSITVSPEPFTNRFALQVQNSHTGIMNIQIQDLNGILRKEFNIIKKEGRIIQIYLAAGELPTGQYIINIQMDGWKASKRVSKK